MNCLSHLMKYCSYKLGIEKYSYNSVNVSMRTTQSPHPHSIKFNDGMTAGFIFLGMSSNRWRYKSTHSFKDRLMYNIFVF